MPKWSREIWGTISTVALTVLLVAGLINDVPTALATMASNGPAILTHPNTYWIAAVVLVEIVALYWIWGGKRDRKKFYLELLAGVSHSSAEVRRIAKLAVALSSFYDAVHACQQRKLNAPYIFMRLELVYPQQVREAFGADAARQFTARVRAASGAGPVIAVDAAVIPILDLAWQEIENDMRKPRIQQPPPATAILPPGAYTQS